MLTKVFATRLFLKKIGISQSPALVDGDGLAMPAFRYHFKSLNVLLRSFVPEPYVIDCRYSIQGIRFHQNTLCPEFSCVICFGGSFIMVVHGLHLNGTSMFWLS
ncbi:hypothetical protein WA026_009956 [Henosepilachna vigintioctopunctata]|uniref:Uncharacterized protein n=1 Tax=Henosepilachna vigintioctopunctata TaxID=420089 RepID=A0AAW1TT82_9CUCU